ncbi:unnamed protein product [Dovyalis caffra]|uniref:Uncharacterized protein n=1 Tax=Dovyalis caffra TaxID=77055 RepID=A0AAV1SA86_9ROSI|nr:unnamed protein product [Dovyalis caffra]
MAKMLGAYKNTNQREDPTKELLFQGRRYAALCPLPSALCFVDREKALVPTTFGRYSSYEEFVTGRLFGPGRNKKLESMIKNYKECDEYMRRLSWNME